jgi:DNA-binding response OmpR family regulator
VNPSSKRLVVLLEDDLLSADALRLILTDWGFECLAGAALAEVLPQIEGRADEVRAIISNDNLQDGATGLEALVAACAHGVSAQGLLLIAGLGGRTRAMARAAGYRAMEKPVTPETLRAWLGTP